MKYFTFLLLLGFSCPTLADECKVLDCKDLRFSEVQKGWVLVGGHSEKKTFQKREKTSKKNLFVNLTFVDLKPKGKPCFLQFIETISFSNLNVKFLNNLSEKRGLGITFLKIPKIRNGQYNVFLKPNEHVKNIPKGYELSLSSFKSGKKIVINLMIDECGYGYPDIFD